MASIGLLTGCGEGSALEASKGSTIETRDKENSTKQCFIAAGGLTENDAKLFVASESGDVPWVMQTIDGGSDVNVRDSLNRTPLFAATFCNLPAVIGLLIDKGSDVNTRDFSGMSALHAAVVVGWDEAANLLIAKGANINSRDDAGRTPIHLAAATNQIAMINLLLERGANAQVRDNRGITPASLASDNGHTAAAATLDKWQYKQ